MSRRALVIGVSGQDGSYLAELLLGKGYQVAGTSRDASRTPFDGLVRLGIRDRVRLHSVVPSDFRSLLSAILQIEPDEIYNLSGISTIGRSFEQPVATMESISTATLNILEAIRVTRRPIRFFNASSAECFGDTGGAPADEGTAFRPRNPYAVAKVAAFHHVALYRQAYGVFGCSGLLFNHESPLRPTRYVTRKIVAAACRIAAGSGERVHLGNLQSRRDWGWAPEYIDAMWRMLQQSDPDDFVVATGETHSLEEFVAEAFSALGLDWKAHVEIDPALHRAGEVEGYDARPAKAERVLGWKAAVRMAGVVGRMIEAERAQAGAERP